MAPGACRSPLPQGRLASQTPRVRRRSTVVLAALAVGTFGLVAARSRRARHDRVERDTEPVRIADGVFCLGPWGRTQTNVHVVRAGTAWFVVDAGWAGDAGRIEETVRRLVGPEAAPRAILLTHVHPDHAGAARTLAEAWDCPILAHPAEIPIARGDFAAMHEVAGPLDRRIILPAMRAVGERRRARILARGSLAGLVEELAPGGRIPGVDGWTWVPTPGHTPGHVSFVRAADRVVLTGDALVTLQVNAPAGILRGRQGLSGPPWYTTWDGRAAAASIRTIADLAPTVVGGGHGRPLIGPATAAAVRAFASELGVPVRVGARAASGGHRG